MPRKQHDYHFIYKTVNKVNEKFYIGMHSTSNLEDGYIGSGKRLWYSIKKYGRENFKMEILEFLPDRSSLKLREKELVNESLLQDPMCMNLQLGGGGGFSSEEHQLKCALAGAKAPNRVSNSIIAMKLKKEKDPVFYKNMCRKISDKLKGKSPTIGMKGKTHSPVTIDKMIQSHSGNKNSQFGKCWIYHDELGNKSINKDEISDYLDAGWIKGRKMK